MSIWIFRGRFMGQKLQIQMVETIFDKKKPQLAAPRRFSIANLAIFSQFSSFRGAQFSCLRGWDFNGEISIAIMNRNCILYNAQFDIGACLSCVYF